MIKFFLNHYNLLTFIVEYSAAITGVLFYKKYHKTPVKYFISFLIFIAIADTLGRYTYFVKEERVLSFLIGTKLEKNHWWANIYWAIGAIMFYSFYYVKILITKPFKKIISISRYTFLAFSVAYLIMNWTAFFNKFFFILAIAGALIIFLCAFLYFLEILQSEEILIFYKSINFYISAIIFIWWLIITPLTFYDVYFKYEIEAGPLDKNFIKLRHAIYLFANIIMYLTFAFALIFCKPEKNNVN